VRVAVFRRPICGEMAGQYEKVDADRVLLFGHCRKIT
jgi:hypothetical protein